jgi:hypothetical protein
MPPPPEERLKIEIGTVAEGLVVMKFGMSIDNLALNPAEAKAIAASLVEKARALEIGQT